MDADAARRILIYGTFDVFNYGDLLFPLIARQRLAPHGFEVVPVSPTAATVALTDAMPPLALDEVLGSSSACDGAMIGGGNIVHCQPTGLAAYKSANVDASSYAGLWIGATLDAVLRDVPVVWNAPGVMRRFDAETSGDLVSAVVDAADYVSVRDTYSRDCLPPGLEAPVDVAPDTALGLQRLWARDDLLRVARMAVARSGGRPDAPLLALHVKSRSLGDMSIEALARKVDEVARRRDELVVLLALGPCHGDDVFARSLSGHLTVPHVVFDRPQSLQEIAAMIAASRLYLGASLHGYITALAYGVPARIVTVPKLGKFDGFLSQVDRLDDACRDWAEACERADSGGAPPLAPAATLDRLEAHWGRVAAALNRAGPPRHARYRLLTLAARRLMKGNTWDEMFQAIAGAAEPERPTVVQSGT